MRPRNHSSLPKGIPKTKLQGSAPSSHNILQSQSRLLAKNRFSVNGLAVVHRRLFTQPGSIATYPFSASPDHCPLCPESDHSRPESEMARCGLPRGYSLPPHILFAVVHCYALECAKGKIFDLLRNSF